jgi:hypothetical protein
MVEIDLRFESEDKVNYILEEYLSDENCNKCNGTGSTTLEVNKSNVNKVIKNAGETLKDIILNKLENSKDGKFDLIQPCEHCSQIGKINKWRFKKIDVPYTITKVEIKQYVKGIYLIKYSIAQKPYSNVEIVSNGINWFTDKVEAESELETRNKKIELKNK